MLRSTLCAIFLGVSALTLADTAITYQGQLQHDGEPFNGTLAAEDITFELFDDPDPAIGTSIAGPINPPHDVHVSSGLFMTELDFGSAFQQPAWLEITVDTDILTPRQRISATPLATHALNVADGVSGVWNQWANILHFESGNLEISFQEFTDSPRVKLGHVDNEVSERGATVSGGGGLGNDKNIAHEYAAVSGGKGNQATGRYSTVAGGENNRALFEGATISGGGSNLIDEVTSIYEVGYYATIGGGWENEAHAWRATVGGGIRNKATGGRSTIAGGAYNETRGESSTIPGGHSNKAYGDYSLAAGRRAKVRAAHDGTFAWADSGETEFESTGPDQFLIMANGGVGIGTNAPRNQLDVVREKSGNSSNINHVMTIDNTATSQGNVLGLRTNAGMPGSAENFITFKAASSNVGAIEGDGLGGITFKSGSADFAEYLPKLNPDETIAPSDVVGVMGEGVSLRTTDGARPMVISTRPIVAGNDPGEASEDRSQYVAVAFLGQVPVRVTGVVSSGDYLVPSGQNDGTAVGIGPDRLSLEQINNVIGQAMEDSRPEGSGKVRALVGLPQAAVLQSLVERRDERLAALESRVENTGTQLARLQQANAQLQAQVQSLAGARDESRGLHERISALENLLLAVTRTSQVGSASQTE